MDISDWGFNATEIGVFSLIVRLTTAALLGGLIGLERELTRHPSGFRTHMLVATAAAMFTILTIEIYYFMSDLGGDTARLDPIRVIEAVTAGVAFLAAGSIIRSGTDVKGLTTGAVMWMAGAVGVACGAGFVAVAIIGTVLALIVAGAVKVLEKAMLPTERSSDEE